MARRPSAAPAAKPPATPPAAAPPTNTAAPAPINLALLKSVSDATSNGGFLYVTPADAGPLGDMIEQNPAMANPDGSGGLATRITAKGNAYISANTPATGPGPAPSQLIPSAATANKFKIRTGIVVPTRTVIGRGREERYPFSTLEVGQGFHVPKSAAMPDPAKTLQSTISSANARFANEKKNPDGTVAMETKVVSVAQRDANGNIIRDNEGKMLRHSVTEQRPVLEYTKRFTVFPVGPDDPDGEGAIITRTQ